MIVYLFVFIMSVAMSDRMRGFNKVETNGSIFLFLSWIALSLTAQLVSNYNYDVIDNPLVVQIVFSTDPLSFDKENCIVLFSIHSYM